MVTEEEVFAVLRPVLAPILSGNLDCWSLWVFVPRVLDVVAVEPLKYFITSFHNAKVSK